jgi:hypothetical protein
MKPAGQIPADWPPRKTVSVVAEGQAVHDPRPLSTGPVIVDDDDCEFVLPEPVICVVLELVELLLAPLRTPEPPHPLHTAAPRTSA